MTRHGEVAIAAQVTGGDRHACASANASAIRWSTAPSCARRDGDKVKGGELIAEWDPYTTPIITEVGGTVKFGDILEGKTMEERVDERTGARSNVIVESKDLDVRPRISIKDEHGKTAQAASSSNNVARYFLPVGAYINVAEGTTVARGRRHREDSARDHQDQGHHRRSAARRRAVRGAQAQGVRGHLGNRRQVSFGKDTKGKRKVVVTPEVGEPREYLIPKGKHIGVHEGDIVKAGEPLMEGSSNPHDILTILGEKALAKYLVDEIQEIYRLQGVRINDKHIEVIVRQMLRRVRIKEVGDTDFLVGDQVEKWRFDEENGRVLTQGRRAGDRRAAAARHHQGVAVDRELHLGGVVPGDHAGADRGGDQRQGRSAGGAQGERHHGPPDPGRHRPAVVQPRWK